MIHGADLTSIPSSPVTAPGLLASLELAARQFDELSFDTPLFWIGAAAGTIDFAIGR